jgi:hypothetical protein
VRFQSIGAEDSQRLGYDARDKRLFVLAVAWDDAPKHWQLYTSFYGVILKNTEIFIICSLTESLLSRFICFFLEMLGTLEMIQQLIAIVNTTA